jgi:hypothetical protein
MNDSNMVELLTDIRNWIRASSYISIKTLLEKALPDKQSRIAYQMFDGTLSMEQVRVAVKISPNRLVTLAQKWTSMGLMETSTIKNVNDYLT